MFLMVMVHTNGKNWEFHLNILYRVRRIDDTVIYTVFCGVK